MEMGSNERSILLEQLVTELIKEEPQQSFVQERMERVGLRYTEDLVTCMNSVLMALQFEEPRKEIQDGKEP